MPLRVVSPRRSLPSYDKLEKKIAQLEAENAALRCATCYLTKQNDEQIYRICELTSKSKESGTFQRPIQL